MQCNWLLIGVLSVAIGMIMFALFLTIASVRGIMEERRERENSGGDDQDA